MRAVEVFTPMGEPGVTYIDDHLVEKRKLLTQSLEMGAGVIVLSGPSKSGKTVFIEKSVGAGNLIPVNGAGVTSAEALWRKVFAVIGTQLPSTEAQAASSVQTVGGMAGAAVPMGVAKVEVSKSAATGATATATSETPLDWMHLLASEIKGTGLVVFVDDFHYIPREVQIMVAEQMKEAVKGGVRFVCASVPYHSDDMLLANSDLRGRTSNLDFDYWDPDELKKIGERGFEALNLDVSDAMIQALALEAAGSPQLMQALCLTLCFETGYEERSNERVMLGADLELISRVCRRTVANNDYSSTVAKMKEGPKIRGTPRTAHVLRDGGGVLDVYPLTLRAIAADPPKLTIRYPELVERIAKLCQGDPPSGSSVTGACAQMIDIANSNETRQVVEWDGKSDVLDIRDPYLLFYLRWGEWRK